MLLVIYKILHQNINTYYDNILYNFGFGMVLRKILKIKKCKTVFFLKKRILDEISPTLADKTGMENFMFASISGVVFLHLKQILFSVPTSLRLDVHLQVLQKP